MKHVLAVILILMSGWSVTCFADVLVVSRNGENQALLVDAANYQLMPTA